ncbi:MAG: PASTA domain-containing protein [Clostridia bacterium]|nr:PASTA domain-containing protein [Clostridia bacterium]
MGFLNIKKRLRIMFFIEITIFTLLIIRIGWIQLIKGTEYKNLANKQQYLDREISAKRGIIYDRNGEILAMSASTEMVTVNPSNIPKDKKEMVAKKISEVLELDYENVLKKVNRNSSIEIISKKIEKEKSNEIRKWLIENNIDTGINIDEDTKRYYPNSTLASQIIGFCGSDNQGLNGLEAKYDEILQGTKGSIGQKTDAKGKNIENENENYEEAKEGKSIELTIDKNIQSIAEKYLEEACIDNECTDGGNIIIMNPKNGDILCMATYPNYNLNEPFKINNSELEGVWEELSPEERNNNLQTMWRNKAIADTYEPGSTFKLVTASAALEEKMTDTDNQGEFSCTGGIEIAGVRIKCWRYYRPHGSQSLREALMNSCNPVFIGIGQKIGAEKYYQYLEKFGFLKKTGIDIPGEASSIFLAQEKVGPVELATISFGQRFEVTPIQMVTMLSTIANKGKYVTPRLVKEIIDPETGAREEINPQYGEQVISEETANKVLNMMESVVSEGTGKGSKVEGYRIGGKTGTSEDGVNTGKYVASFIGVAPIEDPEVVILVTLYNPTGEGGHQGGGVASPVSGKILSEVLPYLELQKETEELLDVKVPNLIGLTITEAEEILKENNLEIKYDEGTEKTQIITKQIPEKDVIVKESTQIIVHTN